MSRPLVSIITPSYNQAKFIEETILSVKEQDYDNVEHIVVDGGSNDGTLEILKKYPLLQWTSEKDRGQSDAINKGFNKAKGDIIGWLNSDDLYLPGAISRAVDFFNKNPDIDLIYTDFVYIDGDSNFIKDEHVEDFEYSKQLNTVNLIPQPTVFFRKSVFDVGYLNESYHYAMDYEFWLRIAQKHKLAKIEGVNACFRLQDESKTVTQMLKFYPEVFHISRHYGGKLISAQNARMCRQAASQFFALLKVKIKNILKR